MNSNIKYLYLFASSLFFGGLCSAVPAWSEQGPEIQYGHGFAQFGTLKYPPGFTHLEYVNPHAPKGGRIRIPVLGTWDSFNHFIYQGREAAGISFLSPDNLMYDRLLAVAADEPYGRYGQLAEGIAVAEDFSWIAFKLREGAHWHDGRPITAADVVFTFETYKQVGSPWIRTMLGDVERIEQIGPREVRYVMADQALPNPGIIGSIGVMPVLPKHYWERRDPAAVTLEPPLGSGPYRIKEFVVGRRVVYERVEDYWGRELPLNVGQHNFDIVEYDYFRDQQVMLEAHKGDLVDIRPQTARATAKEWYVDYDFPAARAGLFVTELVETTYPQGLWWPIFWNLRLERFQDIRVREALWLLYDFEWINHTLNYGFYERGTSLFHGSDMAPAGLPSEAELALLEPWRDELPERVFTKPYQPPRTSGQVLDRDLLERAIDLFAEAGWIVRAGRMVNRESGEQFKIDFVMISHGGARALLSYMDNLNRIGIATSVRVPELSNWQYRMQTGAFDGGHYFFPPYRSPGLALRNHYGSASADQPYSVNWGYVRNPVVDDLADQVIQAETREDFLAAVHAADRVLMWNFYFVPGSALPGEPMAYWDRFGQPQYDAPLERVSWLTTWWWDADRARRVDGGVRAAAGQ